MLKYLIPICTLLLFASFKSDAQDSKYFVSKLYPKGKYEVHIFNNYYTQKDILNGSSDYNSRTSFFTSTSQFLYGVSNKINLGLILKFRSVNQNIQELSPFFDALSFKNDGYTQNDVGTIGYSRTGLTAIGASFKYQPFKDFANISFQHSLYIPIGQDLGGNEETGWIDWGNPSFYNQFYYDSMLGDNFSLFLEFSLILENISGAIIQNNSGFYQFSTPMTLILNYYLDQASSFYLLANAAPRWAYTVNEDLQQNGISDPYSQFGIGYKLYVSQKIQLETLYTGFYSSVSGRAASTINFGFRYIAQ